MSQYILSCHCQTHIYLLNLPAGELEKEGVVCNCSWCLKRRIIWAFVPHDSLTLHRGAGKDGSEELTEYRFGLKVVAHKFCGKCGTYLIMEHNRPDEDRWFINLRAIRNPDFDVWKLPLSVVTSANGPPPYREIELSDIPEARAALTEKGKDMGGETEIYVGSCHCRAVKFAVVCRPLHSDEKEEVMDCACSICLGNGVLWVYPQPSQVFYHPSEPSNSHKPLNSSVFRYTFATGENVHVMCKTCGCHVYEHCEAKPGAHMGLNVALFSRAKEWMRDVHGIDQGTEQFKMRVRGSEMFKGLWRDDEDRWSTKRTPLYEVKL